MPKSKKSVISKKTGNRELVIGILLFLSVGIIPVIVRRAVLPIPPEIIESGIMLDAQREDVFSYYKSWLAMLCAAMIFIYIVSDTLTGGKKLALPRIQALKALTLVPFIAAAAYTACIVLSSIFSKYPYTALHGTFDRFEGVFTLLSYMVLFLAAMLYVKSYANCRPVLYGLLLSSLIIGALGISQLAGFDFNISKPGTWLILGKWTNQGLGLKFDKAYGTMYNPNTFGLYTAMLTPLQIGAACAVKRHSLRILFCVSAAMMAIGVAASGSVGGFLGAGAAVAVSAIAIIIIRFIQRKRMIPWVAIICVLAAVVLTYAFASPVRARLNDQASRLANSLRHFQPPTDQYTFEGTSLTLTDDDGGSMTIVAVPAGSDSFCLNEVYVLDAGGKRVEQASESDSGQYTTRKYDVPGFGFIVIDQFADHFRFRGILFAVYTDQLLPIYKDKKPALTEDSVNAIGFKGYETWASGRGYIWSRSLPLMQRYPIIGSGPDSFVNEFPQRDVIGKQKYQDGNPYITVDKAHSLYIQTAVTTGGVSMLAVLILLLFYLVIAFASLISDARNPAKNPKDSPSDSFFSESYAMRIALLASVSAFAVSSMATDSTVATMSVFWIILGMGYGLEIMRQGSKIDDHGQNLKNQRIGVI